MWSRLTCVKNRAALPLADARGDPRVFSEGSGGRFPERSGHSLLACCAQVPCSTLHFTLRSHFWIEALARPKIQWMNIYGTYGLRNTHHLQH